MGRRVPSVPAGCPVCRLSSSGPLAGGVGVAGSCRWGDCPCTECPMAGSGGGSVGDAAAGVDWSVGWVFVWCCQCRSACWLAGVGVCGGRGSAVSARRSPPRAGLHCRPRCWPLVVLGAGRTMLAPSWCWVQAVVSDPSVVMSHKGDSVAAM